jgi:hypothetical protein
MSSLITYNLIGQYQLSGIISDLDGSPVPYSNIVLFSLPDSVFTKGNISDEKGHYSLEVPSEFEGYLEVSFMGYETVIKSLIEDQITYHFQLPPISNFLDEVMVVAKRPIFEKQADRLVVNPGSNITALGGNALELLEKSPGVSINRISNDISLNGKNGVLVMINDKIRQLPQDALLQLLNSISINDIEKIELITNPSAKYDAAGSGGIIHIVMKNSNAEGVSGNIGITGNYAYQAGGLANLGVNWNKGSLQGFTSLSSQLDRRKVTWSEDIFIPVGSLATFAESKIERIEKIPLHNFILGLNYLIDENTTSEFLWSTNLRFFNQNGNNAGVYQQSQGEVRNFTTELYEKNSRSLTSVYGGLKRSIHPDHHISASLEYIYSYQEQPSNYLNEFSTGETAIVDANKINPLSSWITKADYSWQLNEDAQIMLGSKFNKSSFDNRVDIFSGTERDDNLSNNTMLDEDILSAYVSSNWDLSPQFSLRTGVRMEKTVTELIDDTQFKIVDRNYTNWFLNLSGEYTFREYSRFSFSYNERISRPTFQDLAPFVFYSNPISVFYGNSELLPGNSHTAGLQFSRGSGWVGLEYSWTDEQIAAFQPSYDDQLDILFRFSDNLNRSSMWRLSGSFPIKFSNWIEISNSIFLSYHQINGNEVLKKVSNPEITYQGNLNFSITDDFSIGLTGSYFYRQMWGRLYLSPYGNLDFGIRKNFSNNMSLSFSFVDIFNTYKWEILNHEDAEFDFRVNTIYRHGIRNARIGFSYQFGSTKIKKKEIDTGSAEEKSRL